MATRPADDKVRMLRETGCLHPNPERVRDARFLDHAFFDARDLVQVKYEMLRSVREEAVPVSESAARHGLSRPTYYAAKRAFAAHGVAGLVPARPGPRQAHKFNPEVVAALQAARMQQPHVSVTELVALVRSRFGLKVHPRSIQRVLAEEKKTA